MKGWNWLAIAAITTLIGLPALIMLGREGLTNTAWMITAIMTYINGRAAQQAAHNKQAEKEKP